MIEFKAVGNRTYDSLIREPVGPKDATFPAELTISSGCSTYPDETVGLLPNLCSESGR